MIRLSVRCACLVLASSVSLFSPALAAPTSDDLDAGLAVETCVGCHSAGGTVPVADISDPNDAHYVDLDPRGPATASSYRQLNLDVSMVDVTGSVVIVDFTAIDEDGGNISNLFASDGRMNVARLVDGAVPGDPTEWQTLISRERFTTGGGIFENLGAGAYRYTSVFDPTSVPIAAGDVVRVSLQVSASDLPAGNAWCDFDADLQAANSCDQPVSRTRDIVQTAVCNDCHGVTSDTKLAFHGSRTQVEYCVSCHNPGIGETDFTPLIHKIHYGSELSEEFLDYGHVTFTKDIDDCSVCHSGGGTDELNWALVPTRVACGSCHDAVDFDTGENHGSGGQQLTNTFCINCHPSDGPVTPGLRPVMTVHKGVARAEEAARYRGAANGFAIEALSYDKESQQITADYSVSADGAKLDLGSAPEFASGSSRLNLTVGWSTLEITNEGSDSSPAPAQPLSFSALDIGGEVMDLGMGVYRRVIDKPSGAFGSVSVILEGRPVGDVEGESETIPVRSAHDFASVELREASRNRRSVIDITKCNACHDAAGAGLALHGNNRVNEMQACVLCHNPDATDLRRRPGDPGMTLDGKREETIDMKRMVHGIHAGRDLAEGLVLYGFGGTAHDYSEVDFIGNNQNCLTCHRPGTYGTNDAAATLASTIDSGEDVTDPEDDLNISPIAAACSSCHDDEPAKRHMVLNGASFRTLDGNIIQVPEAGSLILAVAACGTLSLLRRHRRRGLGRSEGGARAGVAGGGAQERRRDRS